MPQLMPLMWAVSVFVVIMIVIMLVELYYYSKICFSKSNSAVIILLKYMW